MNPGTVIYSLAAASVTQSTQPLSERLLIGFEVTGIGLLTVFVVLILLWGILELFRVIFSKNSDKSTAAPQAETDAASDAALVAAITAAVAAYANKPASQLRVVQFRRK